MDKLLNDFRDYGGEQNGDHADSDQRQYDGVDHRLQQAGAELLALLGIVRQPVQYAVEMAGGFAGRHHGAEQPVEAGGIAAHRLRQRVAFEHFAAHPGH